MVSKLSLTFLTKASWAMRSLLLTAAKATASEVASPIAAVATMASRVMNRVLRSASIAACEMTFVSPRRCGQAAPGGMEITLRAPDEGFLRERPRKAAGLGHVDRTCGRRHSLDFRNGTTKKRR